MGDMQQLRFRGSSAEHGHGHGHEQQNGHAHDHSHDDHGCCDHSGSTHGQDGHGSVHAHGEGHQSGHGHTSQAPLAAAPTREQMPGELGTNGRPTRAQIVEFLNTGIAKMNAPDLKEMMKDAEKVPTPGEHLIQVQRAGWDPLGVDRDLGCETLNVIERDLPGDEELHKLKMDFCNTAIRRYHGALEDRQPTRLERKKPMPRGTIIEFFNACNSKMDLPETKEKLVSHMRKTKQPPNQVIVGIQRELLEVLGFEREHGCQLLARIMNGTDYPEDVEMRSGFEVWKRKAQQSMMLAQRQYCLENGISPQSMCPNQMQMPPEFKQMSEKAQAELEALTPAERGEVLERIQKKLQVFMKLPDEGKKSYMQRLSDSEKLEFVKGQMLMMSQMQQEQMKQMKAAQEQAQATSTPGVAAAAPSQQEMM